MSKKVALVTGSNKGLGFAIVKGLCERFNGTVYLTARNECRGLEAVKQLNSLGYKPNFYILDVNNKQSIKNIAQFIQERHGGFDLLVNNAAVLDFENIYPSHETAKQNIDTNYRSLLIIEEFLYPLLKDGARVVNISSKCGHISNLRNKCWIHTLSNKSLTTETINDFVEEYLESVKNGTFDIKDFADEGKHAEHRVSKIALTALTMIQQRKYHHRNISINALYPGHIKTDMAQGGGELDPDEAASSALYLLLDASPDLKGAFMDHNRKLIDWCDVKADYYYKHE